MKYLALSVLALPALAGSPHTPESVDPRFGAPFGPRSSAAVEAQEPVEAIVRDDPAAPFEFDLGEGWPTLRIPRGEQLVYNARVSASIIETTLGTVTLSSGVEPYRPGLILPQLGGVSKGDQETGWLKARAAGKHLLYEMDAWIETRYLPQEFPRIKTYYEHRGTENRRREIRIGEDDEAVPMASYRSDTSFEGWSEPRDRRLPKRGAIETMGAIHLVRSLVVDDLDRVNFPMLTKLKLWNVTLRRGERREVSTDCGNFDAVQVVLSTERHKSDLQDDEEQFEGLFGIHGSIELWVDERTGVPVRVIGDIPAGPITLRCDMSLTSYQGTPEGFRPLGSDG